MKIWPLCIPHQLLITFSYQMLAVVKWSIHLPFASIRKLFLGIRQTDLVLQKMRLLLRIHWFEWVHSCESKGYGIKIHKREKIDFTCPNPSVYEGSRARVFDNSDTWDQLWTSFNIQIIAGKFNSILHITTRLFLRLTEMDVWFRVVRDPV